VIRIQNRSPRMFVQRCLIEVVVSIVGGGVRCSIITRPVLEKNRFVVQLGTDIAADPLLELRFLVEYALRLEY
jgi:hypothetical protein